MINKYNRSRLVGLISLFAILALTILVYRPGLNGPFVLDDEENIVLNRPIALTDLHVDSLVAATLGNDSGPLGRPLASLSFGLNHYFAGSFDHTYPFKVTNLGIHIINSVLVYYFALLLVRITKRKSSTITTSPALFAALVAGLWALHPIQLSNVLYVVQRMNSLSAMFLFAGLIIFVRGRKSFDADHVRGLALMTGGTLGGMALGITSKENAALMPLLALTVEYSLFGFKTTEQHARRHLISFYIAIVALPILAAAAYLVINPDVIASSYATRDFSISERLLTESRVLWMYVGLIVFPVSNHFSLFHDDVQLSSGILQPFTTFSSIAGIAAALVFGLAWARRYPFFSFAILWFVAGHLLEAGIFGLELAHEHRNYLPSFGPLLAVAFGITQLTHNNRIALPLALIGALSTVGLSTWARAHTWVDTYTLAEHNVKTNPLSPRANDFAARASFSQQRDIPASLRYILEGLRLAPNEVGFHFDLQIRLSELAMEVERTLSSRPSFQTWQRAFNLKISSINSEFYATATNVGLRLQHPESTTSHISNLLRTKPISSHGIFSLERLKGCVIEPPTPCRRLQADALAWSAQAADNVRTSHEYRAIAAANAAGLHSHSGNTLKAIEYMDRAVSLLPDHFDYQAARAEYQIRLGQLESAASTIELLTATSARSPGEVKYRHDQVKRLKALQAEAARLSR